MFWFLASTASAQTCAVLEMEPTGGAEDTAAAIHAELVRGLERGGCATVLPLRREQADCQTEEACLRGVLRDHGADVSMGGTVQPSEEGVFIALRVVGLDTSFWWSREMPREETSELATIVLDALDAANWLREADADPERLSLDSLEPIEMVERSSEPVASSSTLVLRAMGGVSAWQLPGASGGLELGLHLGPTLTLEVEGGAVYGLKRETHTPEVHEVLLLPAAVGLGFDPPGTKRIRPSVALLATGTLYSLQPLVSPGFKVRPALDFTTSSGLGVSLEGFVGANVAPGIDVSIDPDFEVFSRVLGARMGFVFRI